jgi:hypothetical protein
MGIVDKLVSWLQPRRAASPPPSAAPEPALERARGVDPLPPVRLATPIADRRSSRHHLLLLSKFRKPRPAAEPNAPYWTDLLGETMPSAIGALLADGLLALASTEDALLILHSQAALKAMAKNRGLKVSGTKPVLVQRLMEAAPDEMRRIAADGQVVVLSVEGRALATAFLDVEAQRRSRAEAETLDHLRHRRLEEATRTWVAFEAGQIFQRGMGIDWSASDDPAGVRPALEAIFAGAPKILGSATPAETEELRVAGGMQLLSGTPDASSWLPPGFKNSTGFDNDVAVRMFSQFGRHVQRLGWIRRDYRYVEVMVDGERACESCRRLMGRRFSVGSAPELPYHKCTSEFGCRCSISPVVHDGDVR